MTPDTTRAAGTIVARNYLPFARVLAASYLRHHPGHRFVTLLVDGRPDDVARAGVEGEVVTLADLPIDLGTAHLMAASYSVLEFSTALKPTFLRLLLDGAASAVYLDPDTVVRAPLDDVHAAAEGSGVALTPHVLTPFPRDGLGPAEDRIRHSGIFNCGVVAVGASTSGPFLEWWRERLYQDARVDFREGLFTDQRWVDWVPALFGPAVLRDPGLNVAYWNLHERPLTRRDGVLHAGGSPVRLVHFSGFEPATPWVLSKHAGERPRVRVTDDPLLLAECECYRDLLLANGWTADPPPYGFSISADGVRFDDLVRLVVRRAITCAELGVDDLPPDPFTGTGNGFRQWLDGAAPGPFGVPTGRWALAFHESEVGLQQHFPRLDLDDAAHYQGWLPDFDLARTLRTRAGLDLPPAPTLPRPAPHRELGGWNVAGYRSALHGVGEAGRRLTRALQLTGLPVHQVDLVHDLRASERVSPLRFRDTVYAVNADMLPAALARLEHHHRTRGDARRVGLWFWELSEMPAAAADALRHLEQVWVTSEFTAAAVRTLEPDIPVRVVTLPLAPRCEATPYTRQVLGLPDGFVFAFSFDFASVMARKNPLDLIEAYRRAFPVAAGTHLVIKTVNGDLHPADLDAVRYAAGNRDDIHVVDARWPAAAMRGLLELADCFVSLHRSEGFGLHLADAMAAGTPVVATGYSGNMEFCDDATTWLVPYELVPVGQGHGPYDPAARWAQPDVDVAAAIMRRVVEHPQEAAARARLAREAVRERLSPTRARDELLAALHGDLAPSGAVRLP